MKKLIPILFAAVAIRAIAVGYSNPVLRGFYPDPSVCRVDSDYYMVNSSFQFFPGVPLWHSRDLVHWQQLGNVLDRPGQLPLQGTNAWTGIYAPTIRYNDGTFYMITTNIGNAPSGSGGNFIVTATDPRGPWSDPLWLQQGGIDPSLYFENGKCYLTSNPDAAIWMCEIDPDTGAQLTPSRQLWEGTGGRHPEAPHIYRRGGWYYLVIAEGGTEMGHSVTVARARHIYGPYESNPGNPILTHFNRAAQSNPIQGTGHADLVEAHDGSWWLVCLGFRTQANSQHLLGRETFLAPVEWNEDGWPVVNGGKPLELSMNVPTLPLTHPAVIPETTDFRKLKALGPEWIYLRNPHYANYTLTPRGLELKATPENLCSAGSPTWVARRQQDIDMRASATILMENAAPGDEAGLCVYMDMDSHYEAFLRQNSDGTRSAVLRLRLKNIGFTMAEHTLAADTGGNFSPVTLTVEGGDDIYRFSVTTPSGGTTELGAPNARYLSTETAGGFTGITIGLYATGLSATAIVENFTCQPL